MKNLKSFSEKNIKNKKKKKEESSNFSRFFRLASPEEKKRVFLEVAREASAEQRKVIEAAKLAR